MILQIFYIFNKKISKKIFYTCFNTSCFLINIIFLHVLITACMLYKFRKKRGL